MTDTLKEILKKHNISYAKVAEKMGVTPQTFCQRIHARDISISTLQGIADAINIDLSELCALITKTEHKHYVDEIVYLRRENELLKALLEEKERFIEILSRMKKERG